MFDHICGKGQYETLFCGQGELFGVRELSARTDAYLQWVEKAGEEYALGSITKSARQALRELLFSRETFEAMADASWGVDRETGQKEDESLIFTRQMAALYNKKRYDGRDRVLEICYTDLGKSYQILLGKDGSEVRTDGSLTPTTRIDTPWDVWLSVSRGEIRGDVAMAKHLYRVSGDFSLMLDWDTYFGGESGDSEQAPPVSGKKPPAMPILLGIFTVWFQKWYPARGAMGKI